MNQTITPLDVETRRRITRRMMKEHQFSEELANAIFDETLVYMHASFNSDLNIGPSALVDIGWHTFILYTREYASYCQRAFGQYLHHNPTDREGEEGLPIQATLDFMTANGITYDAELWGLTGFFCDSRGGGGPDQSCGRKIHAQECSKCSSDPGGGRCGGSQCKADHAVASGCVGHGGPNCGTQIDPRTPCEPILAFANQIGHVRSDCDGGRGGGDSMCGKGNCS